MERCAATRPLLTHERETDGLITGWRTTQEKMRRLPIFVFRGWSAAYSRSTG
jgi:hypothetical protein